MHAGFSFGLRLGLVLFLLLLQNVSSLNFVLYIVFLYCILRSILYETHVLYTVNIVCNTWVYWCTVVVYQCSAFAYKSHCTTLRLIKIILLQFYDSAFGYQSCLADG